MSPARTLREAVVDISRRYSRVPHEVEDLAHDLILSALRRGTILDSEGFLRSVHGAARRHGAFLARSAGRRRTREAYVADHVEGADFDVGDELTEGAPLSVLSPALRTTLLLLLSGLEKAELRLALGVSDAALRQRFQALRKHGPLARPQLPPRRTSVALRQLRQSQVGLLPRLAGAVGGPTQRLLAAGDPDGYGLIFAEVLTSDQRTATSEVSALHARKSAKGNPC